MNAQPVETFTKMHMQPTESAVRPFCAVQLSAALGERLDGKLMGDSGHEAAAGAAADASVAALGSANAMPRGALLDGRLMGDSGQAAARAVAARPSSRA